MRRTMLGVASLIALLAVMSASASAAPITVGSTLGGKPEEGTSGGVSGTYVNLTFGEPTARPTSPVTGAVISWSLLDSEGPFRLRVLRPAGGPSYTGVGSSALVGVSGTGLQTFPTAIPIQAGDAIGLDIIAGNKVGVYRNDVADVAAVWIPTLGEGSSQPYLAAEGKNEVAYNALVQPAPTLTAIAPNSGPIGGRTTVTIAGTDFANVTGVSFGGVPAASFGVASEGQITAVAPRGTKPGAIDVTVTTVAGTTAIAAGDKFTYKACVVPKLKAKTLKAAKKKLKKAGCKVGKVTKRGGVTAKTGEVVNQGKKAGKKLAPGTKVNVTLG